ncbi:unnamed protein product [Phyllotreta striolata]|uniref:Uncharacterized protein n=1 Tax=Phyllotreta striolata TaxID=444603 RepID=A0A9N9TM69_PHYSR|nr:unnamed protein product [Phyllotreta striolata]
MSKPKSSIQEISSHNDSESISRFSRSGIQGGKLNLLENYGGLGWRFFERLKLDSDKIFQVDVNRSFTETKGSVRRRSIQLAMGLRAHGVIEYDIIVICSKNNADQVIVLLATLFLGAIVAPLDPEFTRNEKEHLLKKLRPKICFGDTRSVPILETTIRILNLDTEVVNFSEESCGDIPFIKLFSPKEDESFQPPFVQDTGKTVAFILPTQGTTGVPKLVCLSHDNICLQCSICETILDLPNRVISFFPLSWILQTILICVCLKSSITLIIPGVFSTKAACKLIKNFEIGYAVLGTDFAMKLANSVAVKVDIPPLAYEQFILLMLMFISKNTDIKCLKCVVVGIVNTSKYDIRTLRSTLPGVKFLSIYCMVEAGCIAATKLKDYTLSMVKPSDFIGRLTYNCKVKIVDIRDGELCGPNTYGEVYFYGDGLMLGYFKDKEGTLSTIDKGYFKTGDMGKYDEDGWLSVPGRLEDLIRFDTWSMVPTDLEDIIVCHEHVKDAAVIGDNDYLIAVVQKTSDSQLVAPEVYSYITRQLHRKYWPNQVILLEHFPRTTVGAVRKNVLRKAYLYRTIMCSSSFALEREK